MSEDRVSKESGPREGERLTRVGACIELALVNVYGEPQSATTTKKAECLAQAALHGLKPYQRLEPQPKSGL